MARDSVEEDALVAAALKLSATDISAKENPLALDLQPSRRANRRADAEVEEAPTPEGQVEANSAPVSILKNRKHTEPPPCLDRLELEGDTGRKAPYAWCQCPVSSA